MISRWRKRGRGQIGRQRGQRSNEERLADAQLRLNEYMRRPVDSAQEDDVESAVRWGFDANGSQAEE